MKTILIFSFSLCCLHVAAQITTPQITTPAECEGIFQKAKTAEKNGNYRDAINNFNAVIDCNPARKREINSLILDIFGKIEAQRNVAVKAKTELQIEKKKVETERDKARKAQEEAQRQAYRAEQTSMSNFNVSLALKTQQSNPTLALRIAERNYQLHPTESAAEATYFRILGDTTLRFYKQDILVSGPINCMAVHPEESLAAAGLFNGDLVLWNIKDTKSVPKRIHTFQEQVNGVVFSPNGRYLLAGGMGQKFILWDLSNLNVPVLQQQTPGSSVLSLGFSPDSERLIYANENGEISILSILHPDEKPTTISYKGLLSGNIAISPDGKKIAACGQDMDIKIWQIDFLDQPPMVLQGHSDMVRTITFSPDGQYLLSSGEDGQIFQWQLNNPQIPALKYLGDQNSIFTLTFHPAGKTFLSGGMDNTVKLWELGNPIPLYVYRGHKEAIRACFFEASTDFIWSGSTDGTLKKWPVNARPPAIQSFKCHSAEIVALNAITDSDWIWSVGTDGKICRWKDNQRQLDSIQAHDGAVTAMKFPLSANFFATSGYDNFLNIWTPNPQIFIKKRIPSPHSAIQSFNLSPKGTYIAISYQDSSAKIAKIDDIEAPFIRLKGFNGRILSMVFAPDEKSIFASSEDGVIRQWALTFPEAKLISSWTGHRSEVFDLSLSRDGNSLYSVSYDHTIRLVNVNQPKIPATIFDLRSLPANVHPFLSVSPDESEIATIISGSGQQPQLCIFRREGSTEPFWIYTGDTSIITTAIFDSSGNFIYTGLADGRIEKRGTPNWFIRSEVAPISFNDLLINGFKADTADVPQRNDPESLAATATYLFQSGALEASRLKWEQAIQNNPSPENYLGLYQVEYLLGTDRTEQYLLLNSSVVQAFAEYFRKNGEWENAKKFYEKLRSYASSASSYGNISAFIYEASLRGNLPLNRPEFFQFTTDTAYQYFVYELTELFDTWSSSQLMVLFQDILVTFDFQDQLISNQGTKTPEHTAYYQYLRAYYNGYIGSLYLERGEFAKSLEYLQTCYQKHPADFPDFIRDIPQAFFMLGRYDETRASYDLLLADPEIPYKNYFLEDLEQLIQSGRLSVAQRNKALEFIQWLQTK